MNTEFLPNTFHRPGVRTDAEGVCKVGAAGKNQQVTANLPKSARLIGALPLFDSTGRCDFCRYPRATASSNIRLSAELCVFTVLAFNSLRTYAHWRFHADALCRALPSFQPRPSQPRPRTGAGHPPTGLGERARLTHPQCIGLRRLRRHGAGQVPLKPHRPGAPPVQRQRQVGDPGHRGGQLKHGILSQYMIEQLRTPSVRIA